MIRAKTKISNHNKKLTTKLTTKYSTDYITITTNYYYYKISSIR